MPRYVALLGGINLGKRRLKMDALRPLFEELDFDDVQTLLASGNVLFTAHRQSAARLENRIEAHLAEALGYEVATYVRSANEIRTIVEGVPSTVRKAALLPHVQVLFFKQPLPVLVAAQVVACSTASDEFFVVGRELYWSLAGKMSESPAWQSREMKSISFPSGTMRNINTVAKIDTRLNQTKP